VAIAARRLAYPGGEVSILAWRLPLGVLRSLILAATCSSIAHLCDEAKIPSHTDVSASALISSDPWEKTFLSPAPSQAKKYTKLQDIQQYTIH
jgi:hypothetical protein